MLNTLLSKLRYFKHEKYLSALIKRGLKIGRNTAIMDGVFLDPPHCFLISIGDNCTLAPNVRLIAHDASMQRAMGVTLIGKIVIHDNCFIGDSTLILPGVRIGPNTIIGSGSVVTKDIPDNSVATGSPARVISSLEEFLFKHSKRVENGRIFRESLYNINSITEEKKKEMMDWLDKKEGYLSRSKGF